MVRPTPSLLATSATGIVESFNIALATAKSASDGFLRRPPLRPRARAAFSPLDSALPVEIEEVLGDRPEKVEHQTPVGGLGVNVFRERPEPDALALEIMGGV